eukprot:765350-Hanusia_phi.AAC.1
MTSVWRGQQGQSEREGRKEGRRRSVGGVGSFCGGGGGQNVIKGAIHCTVRVDDTGQTFTTRDGHEAFRSLLTGSCMKVNT